MNGWASMAERVEAYLEMRRAMGFALRIEGAQLQRFAQFADKRGHQGPVTLALVADWAGQSTSSTGIGPARRLEVIRPLARYCALSEPGTEVPPPCWLGSTHRRVMPYIYTDLEVVALLRMAEQLVPRGGLRPASLRCLIGLLACTGLRVSEALSLQREDVDWVRSLLLVRHTKYRKSRYVPLSPTALQALDQYAALRNRRIPRPDDPAFLLFDNGRAISGAQARYAFAWIRGRLTWDPSRRRPRLYDLRHTFACRRLQAWYQEGRDVNSLLPFLTTYLGHTKVSDTYWYLTGTEALLSVAAGRFERLVQHSTGEPS